MCNQTPTNQSECTNPRQPMSRSSRCTGFQLWLDIGAYLQDGQRLHTLLPPVSLTSVCVCVHSRSLRSVSVRHLVVPSQRGTGHSQERFLSLFLAGGMIFPTLTPNLVSRILDRFQETTENSSLP